VKKLKRQNSVYLMAATIKTSKSGTLFVIHPYMPIDTSMTGMTGMTGVENVL